MNFARDFRASFGSVERVAGTVLGATAFLSWLLKIIPLTIGEILARIVETYRAIVHPAMNALFAWVPFDLPAWWGDAAALYFVLGGAVSRTLWVFYQDHSDQPSEHYGPVIVGKFKNKWLRVGAVLLSIPFWPVSLLAMAGAPYVMRNPRNNNVFSGSGSRYRTWRDEKRQYNYVCNLRTVFLLQVLAIGALTAGAILSEF